MNTLFVTVSASQASKDIYNKLFVLELAIFRERRFMNIEFEVSVIGFEGVPQIPRGDDSRGFEGSTPIVKRF